MGFGKIPFKEKVSYEIIEKFYSVLLIEAQNKVVDSFFRYIEHKREPKERFYMPRRKQFLKIGLMDALQGMIDDKYDILCISLIPGAGKTTIEKFFNAAVIGWFPKDFNLFYLTVGILRECIMMAYTILSRTQTITHGTRYFQTYTLPAQTQRQNSSMLGSISRSLLYNAHL